MTDKNFNAEEALRQIRENQFEILGILESLPDNFPAADIEAIRERETEILAAINEISAGQNELSNNE